MFHACLLHNLPDVPAKDLEHAFEIMVFPNKDSVSFCCISNAQKNEWVSELTHLIDKSLQDASRKLKQSSSSALPPAAAAPLSVAASSSSSVSSKPSADASAASSVVPVRKKTIGAPLIRATKVWERLVVSCWV